MNQKYNSRYNDACQKLNLTGGWKQVLINYPLLLPAIENQGEVVVCPFCTINKFQIYPNAFEKNRPSEIIAECGGCSRKFTPLQLMRKCENVSRVTGEMRVQITEAAGLRPTPANAHDYGEIAPAFEHFSRSGKPLGTLENFRALLDYYDITIRYNEMIHDYEINLTDIIPNDDNRLNVQLGWLESYAARWEYPTTKITTYALTVADENSYHPVREWIMSKKWDGVDRIQQLMNTIESPTPDIRDVLIYRWLVSACAALFEKNFWTKGVLVFTGKQNMGKTSWFRSLYPKGSDFGIEGKILNPRDKDSLSEFLSHWLIELGELSATIKNSSEAFKGFVTNSYDELRRPYARAKSRFRRQTVVFGTVDKDRFLVDESGNARYYCVPVTKINFDHGIDIQQMWAQVAVEYANGEQWHLTDEESAMLAKHNKQFEMVDPFEELICSYFDMTSSVRNRPMSPTEVLQFIGYRNPTRSESTRCGAILKQLFGKEGRNNQGAIYMLPPSKTR